MVETSARPPEDILTQAAHESRGVARYNGFARYLGFAAVVTVLGYSLGYSTIGFAMLFLGALWCLVRYHRVAWVRTSLDLPFAAFGGSLIIAAVTSPFPRFSLAVTLMLLITGAVYFGSFGWLLRDVPGAVERLLRAWAIGAVLAAAVGLAYAAAVYHHGALVQGRAEIPRGVGPNGLGTTLMLGGILCLGLALRAWWLERFLWTGGGLLCFAGLLASGSRASLAGAIVGAAYLLWRRLHTRPIRMLAVTVAGLLLLVGSAPATPQLSGRLWNTSSDVRGNRLRIWRTSFDMIAARPLLGSGFGTFERAYNQRRPTGMSSEPFAFNLWLNLAVETGLLGLAAALWVAIEAVRRWRLMGRPAPGQSPGAHTESDQWRPVVTAMWFGLLVDQFADNTLFSISTSAALWLLLALLVVAPRSDQAARIAQPNRR